MSVKKLYSQFVFQVGDVQVVVFSKDDFTNVTLCSRGFRIYNRETYPGLVVRSVRKALKVVDCFLSSWSEK